jgi:hypothetical protein
MKREKSAAAYVQAQPAKKPLPGFLSEGAFLRNVN